MRIEIHILKSVMALVTAITLFSCEDNFQEIQRMSISDNAPIGIGVHTNTKYLDSGKVSVNLMTPKSFDYTTLEFPYREFPEGVEVWYWDDENKKSIVTSDFAVEYAKSNLVDLRSNVKMVTSDGTTVFAEQMYWDQKNKWVFTDKPYKIQFKDGSFNEGQGFNSSENFKTFMSRKNQGVQLIDKTKETNGI
jgi:LPS export ABC transporter protein LptC